MNMTKRLEIITLAVASLMVSSLASAGADLIWNFSYVDIETGGSLISAAGTLTTSDLFEPNIAGTGVGGYEITGISGQRNGLAITGLVPNPLFPNRQYYNVQYGLVNFDDGLLSGSQLDNNGLLFTVGSAQYNLFSQQLPIGGGYYEWDTSTPWPTSYVPVEVTITPVPEPSCIAGALLVLAVVTRQKPRSRTLRPGGDPADQRQSTRL